MASGKNDHKKQAELPFESPKALKSLNSADWRLWPAHASWQPVLQGFFQSGAGRALGDALNQRLGKGEVVFPANPLRALAKTPLAEVKLVLIGQDPYPTAGHADGLCFSSASGRPKSLARIVQVLQADRPAWNPPAHSRLDVWAEQGVLMLNTALTVAHGEAGSHTKLGWHSLTSQILQTLQSTHGSTVKYMLWGGIAQRFANEAFAKMPLDLRPAAGQLLLARHPSYDIRREFMASGSHFAATADLINWWAWA